VLAGLFTDGECDRGRPCGHLDPTLGRSRLSRKSARRLNEGEACATVAA
jgi:hypothetical protein